MPVVSEGVLLRAGRKLLLFKVLSVFKEGWWMEAELRCEHSSSLAGRAGGGKPASRSALERLFLTCCLHVVIICC